MSKFWKLEDKAFLLKLFFGGFFLILVSKGLDKIVISDSYPLLSLVVVAITLFIKEAGIAIMIAAVLGYTVEELSRAKQLKEINEFTQKVSENVLAAVFKKIIPDSIYGEVKRSVLDQTIIKLDAKLRYNLKEIPKSEASKYGLTSEECDLYLICEVTTTHKLKNLSEIAIKGHEIKCGVSCDLHKGLSEKVVIHRAIIGEVLTEEELQKSIELGDGRGVKQFKKVIDLEPEEELSICFCSTTFKRIEDTEVWTTLTPTENMTVEISFPEKLEVGVRANHPKKAVMVPANPADNIVTYELTHGVFPFQGITFWWHLTKA